MKNGLVTLSRIGEYHGFQELNWRPLAVEIDDLQKEKRRLEAASDILQTLAAQLAKVQGEQVRFEQERVGFEGVKQEVR